MTSLLPHDETSGRGGGPADRSADLEALVATAMADGSRVVAVRLLPSTLSAVVIRRTGWLPPCERGAVEIRRWRRGSPADWFPCRTGIHLDAGTVTWLASVLAKEAASGPMEGP
ncbi:MAG: hypothetical protein IT460_04165 [Planctomycetes bacterium]|nr:hypothetical protein [Planctomycetota bacterium]